MNDGAISTITAETIDGKKIQEYLDAFGYANDLSQNEVKQFTEIAQAFQLNPFKREIYCIPYGEGEKRRLSIITGYEVYLKRAERVGKLSGWKAWTEGDVKFTEKTKDIKTKAGGIWHKPYKAAEGNLRALVEIHRVDWNTPFVHEVYLDEYYQDNEMWGSKPRTMLKKVAIAQAFRLAFPDEMGGMPYTRDELPDEMGNVTEPLPVPDVTQLKEQPPKLAPSSEIRVFRDTLDLIAKTVSQTDENGNFWFTEGEKTPYRTTAQSIGTIKDKDTKLHAMQNLLLSIQGALVDKQDTRDSLNSAASAAFVESKSQQEIF